MANTLDTIDHATLARLVEAGAVRGAQVIGQPGGWGVVVQYGVTERALAAKRGAMRIFRKFETLAAYLAGIGILRYEVDASQYDPLAFKTERSRADASARMTAAHDAAAYDKWLVNEIGATRAALADGSMARIEPEAWDKIRAAKLLQRQQHPVKLA